MKAINLELSIKEAKELKFYLDSHVMIRSQVIHDIINDLVKQVELNELPVKQNKHKK